MTGAKIPVSVSSSSSMALLCSHRLNFSLDDLAVVSPYYQHFRRCLELRYPTGRGDLVFQAQQMTTDFPQYSDYDRVKELVRNLCVLI